MEHSVTRALSPLRCGLCPPLQTQPPHFPSCSLHSCQLFSSYFVPQMHHARSHLLAIPLPKALPSGLCMAGFLGLRSWRHVKAPLSTLPAQPTSLPRCLYTSTPVPLCCDQGLLSSQRSPRSEMLLFICLCVSPKVDTPCQLPKDRGFVSLTAVFPGRAHGKY